MKNMNVKVSVKVTNGTFSKKQRKNSNLVIVRKKIVMCPEYIYKSFDILIQEIIANI